MRRRMILFFGLVPIFTLYTGIAASILISPWFNWINNALSDLGHATRSSAAPVFNFTLVLTGAMIIIYSILFLQHHAKWTAYSFVLVGLSLQLVGAFNETYGLLHFYASFLLFLSLLLASLAYFAEKRCFLALITLLAAIPWVMYFSDIFFVGPALPEIISSFAVMPCYFIALWRTYKMADGGGTQGPPM